MTKVKEISEGTETGHKLGKKSLKTQSGIYMQILKKVTKMEKVVSRSIEKLDEKSEKYLESLMILKKNGWKVENSEKYLEGLMILKKIGWEVDQILKTNNMEMPIKKAVKKKNEGDEAPSNSENFVGDTLKSNTKGDGDDGALSDSGNESEDALDSDTEEEDHNENINSGVAPKALKNVDPVEIYKAEDLNGDKFQGKREDLAYNLYDMYRDKVFGKALPDRLEISWNNRLTKTAGMTITDTKKFKGVPKRVARIELSNKVIGSLDRLSSTMIHEMCHAAAWLDGGYDGAHGGEWVAWTIRAIQRFPKLKSIDRCHDFTVNARYTYKCQNPRCRYEIQRFTKSLNVSKKVCGHCKGNFKLIENWKKKKQ